MADDKDIHFATRLGQIEGRQEVHEKKINKLEENFDTKINGLRDHLDQNISKIRDSIDTKINDLDVKLDKLVDETQKERMERKNDESRRAGAMKTITVLGSIAVAIGTVFSSVVQKIFGA